MSAEDLDPGWLRHRVVIESPSPTPDGAGGETVAWNEVATVWARIEPLRADEPMAADHLLGAVTHRVTLRWRNDVTGGMRLAWRGRVFAIGAVFDPNETQRTLVALAREEAT